MTISFLLIIFVMILVAEIGILTFKIYQFTQKANKLYNYFIRSEQELNGDRISFSAESKGLPPTNGECPTKEQLDEFEP